MPKSGWLQAVQKCADPHRALTSGNRLESILGEGWLESLDSGRAQVLATLLAGSQLSAECLLEGGQWLQAIDSEYIKHPRYFSDLLRDLRCVSQETDGFTALRLCKQREMLRIAARDLNGFSDVSALLTEISNVADVCLAGVVGLVWASLTKKLGVPCAHDASERWLPVTFCVFGLGKLGGQELNYSSDVDLLFVYSGDGFTFRYPTGQRPSGKGVSNAVFFGKLAEAVVSECTRMTAEGFLYRVDLRLRPEGKASPLARTLSSYENYYAQWGQTWERMMLIKARRVAGDAALASEFLEMIQPFRYPRSVSEQIPREVAEMKARIENEVVRSGELDRNVKLGRGGIREVEFLVQTLQLLHGGRNPFLQGGQTLSLLDKLADYGLIQRTEAKNLRDAYCFLRKVEHRLQMEANQQTHTIPVNRVARMRLARLMGFQTLRAFERALERQRRTVRRAFEKVVGPPELRGVAKDLPVEVESKAGDWARILQEHSFRDPVRCVKLVQEFIEGPGFGHRSSRTRDHAFQLLRALFALCPRKGAAAPPSPFLSDPDRVLARLDAFIARYGARAMLYEAWVSNSSLFQLLLLAFDRSEFLAELAIKEPDLVDEIEQSGQLRRQKSAEQILADLRHGRHDKDQYRWMRRYFQGEQMRIGLRDILDLATPEQTQAELSSLADAFIAYALEVVLRKNRRKRAPFAIFGLGKLGGRELNYASDLDVIFVANDSIRNLPSVQTLAVQFLDLLTKRTEDGRTFAADARLRPDGEKGLLVNTLAGCAEYYRKRAMLWEIQALSRFRPIAGDPAVLDRFAALARSVTRLQTANPGVPAHSPSWRDEIQRMRFRIERERTPLGQDALAIKTGRGGLMDVEFVAQTICLEQGWHEPNTLAAIGRSASARVLSGATARVLVENYRKLMAIERILRRWSFEPESVLPVDPAPFYRVAVRCGFRTSEEFARALAGIRLAIREHYLRFFDSTRSSRKTPRPGGRLPSGR